MPENCPSEQTGGARIHGPLRSGGRGSGKQWFSSEMKPLPYQTEKLLTEWETFQQTEIGNDKEKSKQITDIMQNNRKSDGLYQN